MNGAFEDAFYQLDSNRDGVVTLSDLQRYVRENHLKDKFIQKWLTLFGDEKQVIYYDKFCETMGIVPALEKFVLKTYKLDITDDTRNIVIEAIKRIMENDEELGDESQSAIKEILATELGDTWAIKVNPSKSDLNVDYAPDGYLYYSPSNTEIPKILVYREVQEIPDTTVVYKRDMSDETTTSIKDIIAQHLLNKGELNPDNISDVIDNIENAHGDRWGVVLNPSHKQLETPYEEDGILYYSLDDNEDPKILVWRKAPHVDVDTTVVYKKDMSDETTASIQNIIAQHILNKGELNPDNISDVIDSIENANGDRWGVILNPSHKQLETPYEEDGILYYSLDDREDPKVLVWRKVPRADLDTTVVYKKDMSNETTASIQNIIAQHILNKGELNPDNISDVIDSIENVHGDRWGVILNPSHKQLETPYEEDGLLYYSLDDNEDPKVLVWRKAPHADLDAPRVYSSDMTDETKKLVTDTVEDYLHKDDELADDTINAINRKLSAMLGDKWKVKKDPADADLRVKYAPDGLLYYSPNGAKPVKLLVYREDMQKEIIYEAIMSDSVKEGVLKSVRRNYNPKIEKLPKGERIIIELNDTFGPTWNMLVNPSAKDLKVDYDFDGKIYFAPNGNENVKLLIWRKDKEKVRGKMCFCCF